MPTNQQTVTIIPWGCVHSDDPGFNEELWEECVEQIVKTPLCWTVGLGDYFTFARTHYREHIRAYKDDEDSQREIDAMIRDRAREFYKKYLRRMKGKLLGLAEGNHGWRFQNGTTDTQMLCELADVPYLGYLSWHRLRFVHQSGHSLHVLKMLVHHGDWSAGGMTSGGDVNALEKRAEGWNTDIFLAAHTHRKHAQVVPIMDLPERGELRIVERPRVYIRCGCFMKGYVPKCMTYVERKMLRPTALGWVTLRIQFYHGGQPEKYAKMRQMGLSMSDAKSKSHDAVRYRMRVEF